jgi:hypothetical protein
MKSTVTTFVFLLLAATSSATFAREPVAEPQRARTEATAERSSAAPETASTPSTRPSSSVDTRKQKRCRHYHKTVVIACRKPTSR